MQNTMSEYQLNLGNRSQMRSLENKLASQSITYKAAALALVKDQLAREEMESNQDDR